MKSRKSQILNWQKIISRYFIVVKTNVLVMFVRYESKFRAQHLDDTEQQKHLQQRGICLFTRRNNEVFTPS